MRTTEIDYKAVFRALSVSSGESTSDYTKRDELFLFRGRPLKGMNYNGKNKSFLFQFWDGTSSMLTMMDNGSEKGAVIDASIDEDELLSLSKLIDEPIEYSPVPGANLLGFTDIDKIMVEKNHFVVYYKDNSQTERYYCG